MFALMKNGRLVKLTSCSDEATGALAAGCVDGIQKVETAEEVAALMEGGVQAQASDEDNLGGKIMGFVRGLSADLENAASELYDKARSIKSEDVLDQAESAMKQARNAGQKALDDIRDTVHKATAKKSDCCGGSCETDKTEE